RRQPQARLAPGRPEIDQDGLGALAHLTRPVRPGQLDDVCAGHRCPPETRGRPWPGRLARHEPRTRLRAAVRLLSEVRPTMRSLGWSPPLKMSTAGMPEMR